MLFSQTWHPLSLLRKTAEIEAAPSSHWTSQPRKTQRHGLKTMVQFFVLGNAAVDTANFRTAVGPCKDLSLDVPNRYRKVVFNRRLTWEQIVRFPMEPNTVYVLESRLISTDGATQISISEFEARRWHNSKVSVWLVLSGLEIPILPTRQILHLRE